MGLKVIQNAYLLLLTHIKQLLLMTFCDATEGIRASFLTHTMVDRQKNIRNALLSLVNLFHVTGSKSTRSR